MSQRKGLFSKARVVLALAALLGATITIDSPTNAIEATSISSAKVDVDVDVASLHTTNNTTRSSPNIAKKETSNDPRMTQTLSTKGRDAYVNQIHFVTYGNDDYAAAKKRIVNEATETGWFATVKAWGPEDLSATFQEKYKELLALPRGGGYWIWKFDVIEQTMATIQEGHFLVYLDAGSQLNKGGAMRFFEYINMVNESQYNMIGFQLPFPEYKWTTPRLFDAFNVTDQVSITHSGQMEGGTLVFQKGPHSRKWMTLCKSIIDKDPWMLTDRYNEEAKRLNTAFRENRHDQSVMSVARKKLGYVHVHGMETKNSRPEKPFHVMRKKD